MKKRQKFRLPAVSGRQMIKVLMKICYRVVNKKGDHITLSPKCASERYRSSRLIIPLHKELKKGTIMTILARADISKKEFIRLLQN